MSRTTDPPNDPMAHLDTQRCDTRALDVSALRAIHDAYVTGLERGAAGGDAAKARFAGLAGDGDAEPAKNTVNEPVGDTLRDPEPPDSSRGARGAARSDDEGAGEPVLRATVPSDRPGDSGPPRAAGSAVTVEVDYSPASRMHRARSMRVQRAARIVTLACVVASVLVGLWAAVRAGRRDGRLSDQRTPVPALSAAASLATSAPAARIPSAPTAPEPAASTSATSERRVATPPPVVSSPVTAPPAVSPPMTAPPLAPPPVTAHRRPGTAAAGASSTAPSGRAAPPAAGALDEPIPE